MNIFWNNGDLVIRPTSMEERGALQKLIAALPASVRTEEPSLRDEIHDLALGLGVFSGGVSMAPEIEERIVGLLSRREPRLIFQTASEIMAAANGMAPESASPDAETPRQGPRP